MIAKASREETKNIVREGKLTYNQALNLAKAGTIESITFDAYTGAVNRLSVLYVCCCLFCTDLLGRHRREHDYGEYYCTDTAMNAKISIERPRHPSLPTTSGRVFESHH